MIGIVAGMVLISGCPQVLADSGPPWVSTTLDNLSYTEQEGWKKLDTDVTVTSGTNDFSDGYIEVNLADANSYDELRLVSNGSLSVTGDAVYWSDSRIGTINNAYDGSNGQLRIDFSAVAPLSNANFETGDLTGWTVDENYPGVTGQAWVESPLDDPDVTTVDTSPRVDDHNSVTQSAIVQSDIKNEGTYALKLTIGGTVSTGYGTAHGPMVTSSTFTAAAGDSLSVNWNAVAGGDWYDVYGFIFKDADNDGIWDASESYQKLFHDVGDNTGGWITTNPTITSGVAGENIRFVFLNGNYDKTGGRAIGSSLYIDGITLEISNTAVANDNIVSCVVENIEYNNTNDDPCTTKEYNLNFKQSDGGTGFNTANINIIAVNDPPTDISLSNNNVDENQAMGTTVGSFTTVDLDGDTHTYTFVSGMGDDNNAAFSISSNQLKTGASFDYETMSTYSVRVRSTDSGGQYRDEVFTITVNDVAEAPTDITLDNNTVDENQPSGTTVGSFTTTDPEGGTHTYTLVSGTGGANNAVFSISSNQLKTGASFDYETMSTYSVRVRSTDSGSLNYEEAFTITVNDVNDAPNAPTSPQCEEQTNPIAVTDFTPEFSWTFSDPDGNLQSAYQIIVGTTAGSSNMWSSGKVASSVSSDISYAGSDLAPGTTYHWKVTTWDNHDAAGSDCADQTFTTSLICACGDVCVNTIGWWHNKGSFNQSDTPIQHAINNAGEGNTIFVSGGTYNENVNVNRQHLTLRGEGVDVIAASASDHVFEVTVNYVNISRFNVSGATVAGKAGIYLNGAGNCNISQNNASNNDCGIYLTSSSNNLIYNNHFNNTNNAYDDGSNIWNTTPTTGTNIIGRSWLGGNYWSDYAGRDTGTDGLGDTLLPYNTGISAGGDYLPLVLQDVISPDVIIDVPTASAPVYRQGGGQFRVNFTYTELNPANYTVTIRNSTTVINSTTRASVASGTDFIANETFHLNTAAADGWYNVAVEMYDNASNHNITYRNQTVAKDDSLPAVTIDTPTASTPVYVSGGQQFRVNFTYTELNPKNYTVNIMNATAVINSTTNSSPTGGTDMTANESFNLNTAAADGWYNVTVLMYDNASNHNITYRNQTVAKDDSLPAVTIDTPTTAAPVYRSGGQQFWVNFTYAELCPANYTVNIVNATTVINSTTNSSPTGGTGAANESFNLNTAAADGWYNVTVEMYDILSNHHITYQNHSILKDIYNATISQPGNQTTNPNMNATYTLTITNTGNISCTFTLAATNHGSADIAVLNMTTIADLAVGASQSVILNVTDADAGRYNVTVSVASATGSVVANTSYIMTTVRGPTLTLGNVNNIARDWGINFNLNHSATSTNATASNVNVAYNVSWIADSAIGTIATGATAWHNQSLANSTVQNIAVKVDANTTTTSATNDSQTFRVSITKREIVVTANPPAPQTVNTGTTFHITASANDEHGDTLICKADLIRDGITIETKDVTNGNADFSRSESAAGTFDFTIRFHNTTHYNNQSTSHSSVTVNGPALTLGNVHDVTRDWGRSINLNHAVTVTRATANNVNVAYNVPWISGSAMGTMAKDETKWHNQSIENLAVQETTVRVDATSTSGSATNDAETFQVSITKRDIQIDSHPIATQTVDPNTAFHITASASDEHGDALICKADLIRDGTILETINTPNGNADFSRAESAAGTFDFTIRFHNTTHYNNQSTSHSSVTVNGPALTLGNVHDVTRDWGRSINLNHAVTVTRATANNVNVAYNVPWISGSAMGTMAKDETKWHNQSIENLAVQETAVRVDATTTSTFTANDSGMFQVSITKRDIGIVSHPASSRAVDLNTTFHITASANDEYGDTLICKADLIRDGIIIETIDATSGNADFSRSESAAGTFDFTIRFHNTTHYNNATTSNCTVSVADIVPPVITNVTHTTPTFNSVTISWATDENSDSLVWYGTSTGIYDLSKSSATMVTSHTVKLTGLDSDARYYFVVSSTDCSGNSNVSSEQSFRTATKNGTISGIVTDSVTGRPIRDATASAGGITIRTWTDGTYTIPSIAPGTYTLNVSASGYITDNRTVVTVSSGAINPNGNVGLTPEKVTLATKRGETDSKTAVVGNETIFLLTATNYGSNATFTITNSTTDATVGFVSPIKVNAATSESFNVTVSHPAVGIHGVAVTLTNSTYSKSATIKLTACMKNVTGVTEINSNTTGGTVTGNETVVTDSNVTSGGSVDNSTLSGSDVAQNATVDDSTVMDSSISGNKTRVENGSVIDRSTVDNSTMDNGAIAKNSTVTDSAVDNTTATNSELRENTTVTDSMIVNVTANESMITGVEIDTGYDIILINATVGASASGGNDGNGSDGGAGRPEIRGDTNATVITRGINFANIYTDVLIEDLVLQQTDDETVPENQSTTINASGTVKCDLTVNMTEPALINITETGINPDGEGTESILSDDVSDWIPVGSFICIQHNTSGTGSFTIRRYYDPSLNYTEVYIYYYNTTPNPNEWERLNTTANGTLGGLDWIEAIVDHLSTFVLMGTLGSSSDGDDGGDGGDSSGGGGSDSSSDAGWFATPTPTVTTAKAPAASTTATATDAPPGGRVMPTPVDVKTKSTVVEPSVPAAVSATPAKPKTEGLPWSTAVFAIAGVLVVVCVVVGRRRRQK